MTLNMFEIMVEAYENEQQNPSIMPAIIQTMTRAYTEICQGEDPWTALGNFTNAWYDYAKHIRRSLVNEPLVHPINETEYTRRWAAYCAASVEFLCERYEVPCPEWVHDSRYTLPQPWSGSYTFPDITQQDINTTPLAFTKRNIFCGSGNFRNKYELFEWMLEARRQGMTDLNEIRNYAREKEKSIHGI